ncbi:hypothetical protein FHW12_000352 [Dokdonella fugitiva]|uniref:Uncharacterized protein n=1 Tax=Dokdonella fugitiva TaxID=328517 RepID=A0A839F1R0_9GAMM|nr:hypothetical protein [Dokdonella fugitiva]MBA8886161.1 hypothetical protein [Dokdonella fugitiva]
MEPKIFTEHPRDGGSYIANPDGTFTQREPTTGERPCRCRPESMQPAVAKEPEAIADAAPEAEAAPTQRKARTRVE